MNERRTRRSRIAACLALAVLAACREKSDDPAHATSATSAVDASPGAPSAITTPPPPPVRSAPRAPTRATTTCAPSKPGSKKVYASANGNECSIRGGKPTVVDSEARVAANHHPASVCVDDDCTSDAACGADRVCACATAETSGPEGHPRCIFGNCTTDADCAGFACAESMALGIPSRPPALVAVLGRYCRSRSDTCEKDAACPRASQGERCIVVDGAFRCAMPR